MSFSIGELEKLKTLGNDAMKKHKHEEAVEHYSKAVDMMEKSRSTAPDCELASVIWSNRSAAYAKLLMYDEACSDALMCIQVHPAWYKGHIRLGKVYEAKDQQCDALKCYDVAMKLVKGEDGDAKVIFTDLFVAYLSVARKIYESTGKDLTVNNAELLRGVVCLSYLFYAERFDCLLYVYEMHWRQMSQNVILFFKVPIQELKDDKWRPYQEDLIIFCLKKGFLSLSDIKPPDDHAHRLSYIIVCSVLNGSTKLLEFVLLTHKYKKEKKHLKENIDDHLQRLIMLKMSDGCVLENVTMVYDLFKRLNIVNKEKIGWFEPLLELEGDDFIRFCQTGIPEQMRTVVLKQQEVLKKQRAEFLKTHAAQSAKTSAKPNKTNKGSKDEIDSLKKEINELKDTVKQLSNNNSSDVDMTEDRTVKCVLPENDIKLEVKLSKLTELLAKFNVIKLIENEELQ